MKTAPPCGGELNPLDMEHGTDCCRGFKSQLSERSALKNFNKQKYSVITCLLRYTVRAKNIKNIASIVSNKKIFHKLPTHAAMNVITCSNS